MHAVDHKSILSLSVAPAGGAKRKRNNISDACTACRRSKVKCDEAKPCTRCVNHGWRDSCVSWRQLKVARQRQECDMVRADLAALLLPPPPPPPAPSKPTTAAGAARLQFPFRGLPHRELGSLFAPGEVLPAPIGEGHCAGEGAADCDESVASPTQSAASRSQPHSPALSCSGASSCSSCEEKHCDQPAALIEADTDLSEEDEAFWRSVEHLKAIPIAFFDNLL